MYAVCVYWPFHLQPRVGAVIAGAAFLAALIGSMMKRAKESG